MTTINKQISVIGDDGYANSSTLNNTNTWGDIGKSAEESSDGFYRFTDVQIPQGAYITKAVLSLRQFQWDTGTHLRIYADDQLNPAAPTTASDLSGRTRTTAYKDWDSGYEDVAWHDTPDFKEVIQELVDSYNYSSGSAMLILVDDDGSSNYASHQSSMCGSSHCDYGPKLEIQYVLIGAATLSGVGSFSTSAKCFVKGIINLIGAGSLSAKGTVSSGAITGVVSFSGTGSLSLSAKCFTNGSATFSGVGSLSVSAKCFITGAVTFNSGGTLSAIGRQFFVGGVGFSGSGSLSVVATLTHAISSIDISLYPTIKCIGVVSEYIGDSNQNASVILEYRKSGNSTWLSSLPMSRIYGESAWGGSIIGLLANTLYEVRITYTDSDGVECSNPVSDSVTTRKDTTPTGTGTSYYVATTGSDSTGNGSIGNPWATIQYAMNQVSAGDTVYVKSGKYYEHVHVNTSGTSSNYIRLVSYDMNDKAVLEGADKTIEENSGSNIWTHDTGNIWYTSYTFKPACVVQGNVRLYPYANATDWAARFSGIDGGYYWDSGSNRLYVELPEGGNPNSYTMYVDAHSGGDWWEDSALRLLYASYLHVQGLEIAHYSVGILDQYSSYCTFEENKIHHTRTGIKFTRDISATAVDALIQKNEIFDTSIRDWPWDKVKGTILEGAAIDFWHSGQGSIFYDNTVHGTFNGVAICDIYESQKHCKDIDVYENNIYDLGDDAIASDCTGTNLRVWSNTIKNARSGISVVPLAKGPAYILRNTIVDSEHQAFKIGSVEMDSKGFSHFYHNTIWISSYQSGDAKDGFAQSNSILHNIISRNNIIHCGRLAIYVEEDNNLDFDYDCLYAEIITRLVKWVGNEYTTIAALYTATGQEQHGIKESDCKFVDPNNGNFQLCVDSPCLNVGEVIPGVNSASSPWPYALSAPDMGAYERSTIQAGAATLSGNGSLAVVGLSIAHAAVTFSGTGNVSCIAKSTMSSSASMTGIGSMSVSAVQIFAGSALLFGHGWLACGGSILVNSSATLAGVGSLSAAVGLLFVGAVSLVGTGSLAAKGILIHIAKVNFDGAGNIVVTASVSQPTSVSFTGVGSLNSGYICWRRVRGLRTRRMTMKKILPDVLRDLRTDLEDTGALWTDAELIRCVKRSVADLSRFLPLEKQYEVTVDPEVTKEYFTTPKVLDNIALVNMYDLHNKTSGDAEAQIVEQPDVPRPVRIHITDTDESILDFVIVVKGIDTYNAYIEEAFYSVGGLVQTGVQYFSRVTQVELRRIQGNDIGDALSIGFGTHEETWLQLNNKPIKFSSENVVGMVRDKDYLLDYSNGKIAICSGGGMSAETQYQISYIKSKISIDVSSLYDLIRVIRVEYPVGNIPQSYVATELWGNILTLLGESPNIQAEMTDSQHVSILYSAEHLAPSEFSPGTYPTFIEPTVELSATSLALFGKAIEYEHQAANDYVSARTALSAVAALHNDIDALLDAAEGLITDDDESSKDILGRIYEDRIALRETVASGLLAATNALDSISVADATTYIEAAIASLGNIAASVTKVEAALTAGGAADVAASAVLGAHSFTDVETALSAAKAVLDAVLSTSIDKATTGAEAYLDTGDDKITSLNKAADVPNTYAGYSKSRIEIAQARITTALGFLQEAAQRYDKLKTNNDTVTGYTYVSEDYSVIAEAHQGVVTGLVRKAEQELVAASQITYRERLKSEKATGHVSVVTARISNLRTYIEQSAAYQNASNALVGEAQTKLAEIDRHLGITDRQCNIAEANMLLAQRFREEGAERRNEVWSIWRTPGDYKGSFVQHTTRQ